MSKPDEPKVVSPSRHAIKIPSQKTAKRDVLTKDQVIKAADLVDGAVKQLNAMTILSEISGSQKSVNLLDGAQPPDEEINRIDFDTVSDVDLDQGGLEISKRPEVRLMMQKTDVNVARKLQREIDEQNNYKYSTNVGGDLPKVYAFEVENNIRTVLLEILKPIITQHEKAVTNIAGLMDNYGDLVSGIERVNRKLDTDVVMRDIVKDVRDQQAKIQEDIHREMKAVQKEGTNHK